MHRTAISGTTMLFINSVVMVLALVLSPNGGSMVVTETSDKTDPTNVTPFLYSSAVRPQTSYTSLSSNSLPR